MSEKTGWIELTPERLERSKTKLGGMLDTELEKSLEELVQMRAVHALEIARLKREMLSGKAKVSK